MLRELVNSFTTVSNFRAAMKAEFASAYIKVGAQTNLLNVTIAEIKLK